MLHALFQAALKVALPDGRFAGRLPRPPAGRTIVLGAGKASARMAQAFEAEWPHPCEGFADPRRCDRGSEVAWVLAGIAPVGLSDQPSMDYIAARP